MNRNRIIRIAFYLLVLAVGVFYFVRYKVAPSIPLFDTALVTVNESPADLKSYQGKPIFVKFWASWCGPCIKEMALIEKAQSEITNGMQFVMITDDTPRKHQAFLKKNDYNFDFYRLKDQTLHDIGVYTIPTCYIINSKGEVVKNVVDFSDWSQPDKIKYLNSVE